MKWLRKIVGSKETSDIELIELYKKTNDNIYISKLFDRYIEHVYGSCISILKDEEKSKDASMEIFERLNRDLQKHSIKYFKSWLFTYTRNHCLNILRKEKKNKNIPSQDMHYEPDFHLNIDEQIEATDILSHCLENLDKIQQKIIHLFYFKKTSYKDISIEMNLDFNDIRSKIQNGRRMLKKCLENKGIHEATRN